MAQNDFMATMQQQATPMEKTTTTAPKTNAKFVCPDCGQGVANNLNDCPNCGCPATALLSKDTDEYTYYSDDTINITNKLWSFGGWDTVNMDSVAVYFPTDNISSVSIAEKKGGFLFFFALGLILMGIGIYIISEWEFEDVAVLCIVFAIVSIIVAFILRNRKDIVVKAFNTSASFRCAVNDPEKSKQILNSMLQCLIENR